MCLAIESNMSSESVINPESMICAQYGETITVEFSGRPSINLYRVTNRLMDVNSIFLLVLSLGVRMRGFEELFNRKVYPL